nr:uncharacterized protein K02A2.6-like [Hydra vulgaris]
MNDTNSEISVKINDYNIKMQVDTGSQVTIIPKNFWELMSKPKLQKCYLRLKQFDGTVIKVLGEFEATLETESKMNIVRIIVADCTKNHGLIGMDVLNFNATKLVNSIEPLVHGRLINYKANILLKNGVQPTYFEARPLPIHIRPLVVDKLNGMIQQGLLQRVPPGGSRWASPLVVVRKTDGDLRICADYKIGVNQKICSDSYPIPNIETVFHKMAGMKYFAKIDLKGAYHQIEMDKEAQEITTVNTPIGLLRWTCLPFGIKTASAIFQRAIESVVGDIIPNMIIFQDDICVGAKNAEELKSNLNKILSKLKESGMSINKRKSVNETKSLSFLGYELSEKGVTPDRNLVSKILGISPPNNKKELESFIGLINFYGRHIDKYAEKILPLNNLRKKGVTFEWRKEHQQAFELLKRNLCEEPVVKVYDINQDLELTTDASEKAISGILSQNGHPVLYLSRTLSDAETRYSNIEREALAIVWSAHRARHFLLGRKFKLISDHRPLEFIFDSNKELPKVTSARILRWAIQMMAFDYEISYKKGENIPHADALSRLSFLPQDEEKDQETFIHLVESDIVNLEQIIKETENDRVLMDIKTRIRKNNWSRCSVRERPYKSIRNKLTIEKGIVCNGDLIVPPKTMRKIFIKSIHDDIHCGIMQTRCRLKLEAWWPGYCQDVEDYVKNCEKCAEIKVKKERTLHTWPSENKPWCRVHMDHAHVQGIGLFLILVDSFSGWPEVIKVNNREATTVKAVLQSVFSRNGVPEVLVSDNAAEFHDTTLHQWLKKVGCVPYKTPPYHPQSNGAAERIVETVKMGLRAYSPDKGLLCGYLSRMLLSYRTIPHAGRSRSPSEMMGRQLRSPLTMSFESGTPLWYRQKPDSKPEPASFISQAGLNTAIILRNNSSGTLAHCDQINKRLNESSILMNNEGSMRYDHTNNEKIDPCNSDKSDMSELRVTKEEPNQNRRSTRSTRGQKPIRFRDVKP